MVKKVGILFGMEDTFPWAFIDKVNELGAGQIIAEAVQIDKVQQGIDYGYSVIFDRISQEVPFYRAYLKNASLMGTAVINNPFWWSADEKFFNNCLSMEMGIPVPKTVLLPSNARPDNTSETSFRNLKAPLDWEYIFNYIGFPAYMKPHDGGGWKNVYRVENAEDLFTKHKETGQLVMMLQEEIVFDDYFRVYCLGQKYVHIMPYDPRKPFHERYVSDSKATGEERKKLLKTVHDYTLRLNQALGYDFNTVEFAVRDGVPYAIDFCNPAPDADIHSVGQENFDWIVEHSAKYAIEKAKEHKPKQNNTSWGEFVRNSITPVKPNTGKVSLKTAAEAKKTAIKKAPSKVTTGKSAPAKKTAPAKKAAVKKAPAKTKAAPKPKK
ncbi:ATP-grasp domain-containing protein [Maribacter sp. X9]|uniref:ATP-grasp domain-containing protein n=1 Tax=Maribacter sp. X9 TaxID=3402159 RepID=UPI003AF3BC1B